MAWAESRCCSPSRACETELVGRMAPGIAMGHLRNNPLQSPIDVAGKHWTGSPNKSTDQIGKNCPKNVRNCAFHPSRQFLDFFWTFSDIFRHFLDIIWTFCRHSNFLGCPTICPLQPDRLRFWGCLRVQTCTICIQITSGGFLLRNAWRMAFEHS